MERKIKKWLMSIKRKLKRVWLIGLLLVVPLLLGAAIGGAYELAYQNRIYPGSAVVGVPVGNKTKQEVMRVLTAKVQAMAMARILLVYKGWHQELDLTKFGFSYDLPATVEKVFRVGRSGQLVKDLKDKVFGWFEGHEFDLDYRIADGFKDEIKALSEELTVPVIEPELIIEGTGEGKVVLVKPGSEGQRLETQKLLILIDKQLRVMDFSEIELPIESVVTRVSEANLLRTKARAKKLLNQSLTYKYEDLSGTIEDMTLISFLNFEGGFNEEKLATFSAQIAVTVNREPENAVFRFVSEKNRVEEFRSSRDGWRLDQEQFKAEIRAAMVKLESGEVVEQPIELRVGIAEPEITIAKVNDLGIKELIGRGKSSFRGSIPGREHNIALAAARLNGVLVKPGVVFSFNETVGDISVATGYRSAYIIKEGRTVLDDGGGVCQDSTTLFRAILDAGLPVMERKAHAYRVYYYEQDQKPGYDATVFAPTADLKFKNDTEAYILIQAEADLTRDTLVIDLYGTKDGRKTEISNYKMWEVTPPPEDLYQDDPTLPAGTVKQVDWKAWGAKVKFDYKVSRDGESIFEKTFYSNFRPWQAVFLRGTG